MQFIVATFVAAAFALGGHALPADLEARSSQTCGNATVSLLRGWSLSATDHFYTTNAGEMDYAVSQLEYGFEGDAAQVFTTQVPLTVPLYRMWKPVTDHFYTTDEAERENAIAYDGYSDEGIAAYVYSGQDCGSVPLYRMYNPDTVDHFYTTDAGEAWNAITYLGYSDEGIAAYVVPN